MTEQKLLEKLSDLEHQQWEDWSKSIAELLEQAAEALPTTSVVKSRINDKLKNWESYWVPYEELTDEIKDYDRIYARKIIEVLKKKIKQKRMERYHRN